MAVLGRSERRGSPLARFENPDGDAVEAMMRWKRAGGCVQGGGGYDALYAALIQFEDEGGSGSVGGLNAPAGRSW